MIHQYGETSPKLVGKLSWKFLCCGLREGKKGGNDERDAGISLPYQMFPEAKELGRNVVPRTLNLVGHTSHSHTRRTRHEFANN